jgi:hypothetical protein
MIRTRYRKGDKENGGEALAREFSVDPSLISRIVQGTRWK